MHRKLTAPCAIGTMLAAAALAPAAFAATVRSAPPSTISVEPGKTGAAAATCPAGTRVLSGGFDSPDFDDRGAPVVRYDSTRSTRRIWSVNAAALGGENPGRMIAYAYCDAPAGAIRVRSATTLVQSNNFGSVTATCARDEVAIAGGFSAPGFALSGGGHVITLTSKRSGKRAWYADGINPSFEDSMRPQSGALTAVAYCRKGGPNVFARSTTVSVPAADDQGVKKLTSFDAYCPQGSVAISGGFDGAITPAQDDLRASGALSSFRLPFGVGWRTRAISVSEVGATATGYAYCQATNKG
jgi:hypothetical protein